MKAEIENAKENLFSFLPEETTDSQRIAEILAPINTSDAPSNLSGLRLVDERNEMFTALGKEVAKILAVKATEFPFLRVFHCYKRREEKREIEEKFFKLDSTEYYPSATADSSRDKYKDAWDDANFFALLDNKHGEVSSTCKVVKCLDCKGTGKEFYHKDEEEKIWMTCPRCEGRGKEGICICERCDGKGRVLGIRTTKRKCETSCSKCGGKGVVKSVLVAYLQTESGGVHSIENLHKDSLEKKKVTIKAGKDAELKWVEILEHEPELHAQRSKEYIGLGFDWSRLKDEESRKAARIKKLTTIRSEGGVIDPARNNLSKLPLASKDDLKRVYNACYPQSDNFSRHNAKYASAYFKQIDETDPNVRAKCFDEEISIVTGVAWVKIDLQTGGSFWVNTLTKETRQEVYRQFGKQHTALYSVELDSKYRLQDYCIEVQRAIKEAKKRGISKGGRKCTGRGTTVSAKKRWKFVVLGLLFGFLGLHLAYAKRWFLFLLLWTGFITGGMFYKGSAAEKTSDGVAQHVQQAEQKKSNDDMIGGIGFGVWALLWIGGTLFIKNDGRGNRM